MTTQGPKLARVTDLHPEELFDKEAAGTLSPEERGRLEAHLVRCADCRWEREARRAFHLESLETDEALAGALERLTEAAPHVSDERDPSAEPRGDEPGLGKVMAPSHQHPWVRLPSPRRSRWAVSLLLVSGTAAAWVGFAPAPPEAQLAATAPSAAIPRGISAIGDRGFGSEPPGTAEEPSAEPPPTGATSPSPGASGTHTTPVAAMAEAPAQRTPAKRPTLAATAQRAAHLGERTPASLSAAERFAAGNRARGRGDLAAASQHYTALVKEHAGTPEARAARALLAQLALDEGHPARALAHYDAYLGAGEARPVLSEEALIGRARALSQLGQSSEAARAWRELLKHYPDSAARAEAQRHLTP
ncbi:MAG: zf-HC2 domain-containing protein [Polyangiaceae bacterium]|nr:zf-HC2 domain-containing protein [Polyangiaceae bacterium]MCW5789421.1 zf-HC2 domain-containing protein [Polyangiaceae bacterium]